MAADIREAACDVILALDLVKLVKFYWRNIETPMNIAMDLLFGTFLRRQINCKQINVLPKNTLLIYLYKEKDHCQ